MSINKGYFREDEMIHFLNNQKVSNLNKSQHELLRVLFGVVEPDEIIKCDYAIEYTKPDFVITYKEKNKYVSMKSGKSEVLHSEMISTLIPFLRSIGVSENTLRTILLYHFGDGTVNGTGKERYSIEKLNFWLADRIKQANKELNSNEEIINKFVDRIIFQGVKNDVPAADCIYHGNFEYGIAVNKKQILKYIKKKYVTWAFYDRLHIGPLFLRPHARYIGKEIKNEIRHMKMDVYWPKLSADLAYIDEHFDCYTPLRHRTYDE